MTDYISIESEQPPWQPSSDARLLETYDFYDRPLVGVIAQGGILHLFMCLEGQVKDWNVWNYSRLEPDERSLLETTSDFDDALDEIGSAKPSIVALSRDGMGIVASAVADHPDEVGKVAAQLIRQALANYPAEQTLRTLLPPEPSSTVDLFDLVRSTTTTNVRGQETWYSLEDETREPDVSSSSVA